jgi:hypothetical protein
MCDEGGLALVKRFEDPDAACDAKTYRAYVEETIAKQVTTDELAELCRHFAPCDVTQVVDRIVTAKLGKHKRKG